EPLAPLCPKWVSSVAEPRRATFISEPKRKLWHHGVEVEPLRKFDPEDRKIYHDTRYPWGTVCRIVAGESYGSGVIVGPRHVLTASHVVDWTRNGAGIVEVHRSGRLFVSAVSAITIARYYTKVTGQMVEWSEVDEDYAVLITADRIGDRFGAFGVRTYDSAWDDEPYWYNIGYPGVPALGRGEKPIWQKRKWLDEDEWDFGSARSMTTDADVNKGQSGGPLFAFWPKGRYPAGPYVVAVVSGEDDENWCAGGSDLTKLVRKARTDYP
ncbi:MAG: trypsin-like serine peptidase, partial [Ignavibacteriales bacterium]